MSDNPCRAPGATVLPTKVVEVPSTTDKRHLLDAVAVNNGTTINQAMHEQRFLKILEELVEGMDHIIQRSSMGLRDAYYFTVPYLRSELVEGKVDCAQCRKEWDELDARLRETFKAKDWDLSIGLVDRTFQPWDLAFWRKSRMVGLVAIVTLKSLSGQAAT